MIARKKGEFVSVNGRRYTGLREKRVTPWKGKQATRKECSYIPCKGRGTRVVNER